MLAFIMHQSALRFENDTFFKVSYLCMVFLKFYHFRVAASFFFLKILHLYNVVCELIDYLLHSA
jgi:hypothetical protein